MNMDKFAGAFGSCRCFNYLQFVENKAKNITDERKLSPGDELLSTARVNDKPVCARVFYIMQIFSCSCGEMNEVVLKKNTGYI